MFWRTVMYKLCQRCYSVVAFLLSSLCSKKMFLLFIIRALNELVFCLLPEHSLSLDWFFSVKTWAKWTRQSVLKHSWFPRFVNLASYVLRKLYTNKEKENSRIAEYTLTEGVCTFGCITNRIRSDFAHFYSKIHHFIVCGLNNTTM